MLIDMLPVHRRTVIPKLENNCLNIIARRCCLGSEGNTKTELDSASRQLNFSSVMKTASKYYSLDT